MEQIIKGKVYCIRNTINDKIYVGSTIQGLSVRMAEHRRRSKKNNNMKIYFALRELGVNNFYIELIENYDCKTKEELRAREQYYIRLYDCFKNGYNNNCAKRDVIKNQEMLEYYKNYNEKRYEENKDQINKRNKKFYENNKVNISEYSREYYIKNKDHINNRNKDYNNRNKDKISECSKNHYEKNKESILKRRGEKIKCEICNSNFKRNNKSIHEKSKKHQKHLLLQEQN